MLLYRPYPKSQTTTSVWGSEEFCLFSWCFYKSVSVKKDCNMHSSTIFSSPYLFLTSWIAVGMGTALDKMLAKV